MKGYRDFENDPVRFSYKEGAEFLSKLHDNGQHWVPIVDSAIYAPNPENVSDAYPSYDRGVAANAFLMNPDGSPYIGAVWPGYTVFPDWVGAVLNGSGAIDWWINELDLWYKDIEVSFFNLDSKAIVEANSGDSMTESGSTCQRSPLSALAAAALATLLSTQLTLPSSCPESPAT